MHQLIALTYLSIYHIQKYVFFWPGLLLPEFVSELLQFIRLLWNVDLSIQILKMKNKKKFTINIHIDLQ
jgi:hypothetical protein